MLVVLFLFTMGFTWVVGGVRLLGVFCFFLRILVFLLLRCFRTFRW